MKVTNLALALAITLSIGANAEAKPKARITSCELAYSGSKDSPSTGEVLSAAESCEKAREKACAKNDGTNVGRAKTSACELAAAYAANKSVNDSATAGCEKAHKKALASPSTDDATDAAELCNMEQREACVKMVQENSDGPETGDGRLIGASCSLTAAHAGYVAATKKPEAAKKAKKSKATPAANAADEAYSSMSVE